MIIDSDIDTVSSLRFHFPVLDCVLFCCYMNFFLNLLTLALAVFMGRVGDPLPQLDMRVVANLQLLFMTFVFPLSVKMSQRILL